MPTYEENYVWGNRAMLEAVANMRVGVPNNLAAQGVKDIATPLIPASQIQGAIRMGQGLVAKQILIRVREKEDEYARRLESRGFSGDAGKELALAENARLAVEAGVGQCSEMAAISFIYLRDQGKFPIDYVFWGNYFANKCGLTFAILGRESGSDINEPESWGASCVIVDPHKEQLAFPPGMIQHYFGSQVYKLYLRLEAPTQYSKP